MNSNDDFSRLVKDLQKKIDKLEENEYSATVINEYRNPFQFGFLQNPDTYAQVKGPCGDTMRFDLKIQDDIITDAWFWTDGCGASVACGSMLTKMITNKSIEEIAGISKDNLLIALHGLPAEHQHCAILAITTLHKSINKYQRNIGKI